VTVIFKTFYTKRWWPQRLIVTLTLRCSPDEHPNPAGCFPAHDLHGAPGGADAARDFFSSHIRNPNTRRAYREAVLQFSAFRAGHGIVDLAQVEPVHVAAFVEAQLQLHSRPTVKLRLAALRMLFDWMVVGQVLPVNPAHAVRGPKPLAEARQDAGPPGRRSTYADRRNRHHFPSRAA
jgi:hypothetical protein